MALAMDPAWRRAARVFRMRAAAVSWVLPGQIARHSRDVAVG
ncbi:hypothetical protein F4559_005576 [Saccharothrix violaceirubra]|uniref:Uncharacterized protein n=1 Tax=Saccharothrix violaceirubra TaxID=413306 RepID=A0A7W7T921_9PSEU|nr:hypothetical protein [Saccharothrix violaceirubra]